MHYARVRTLCLITTAILLTVPLVSAGATALELEGPEDWAMPPSPPEELVAAQGSNGTHVHLKWEAPEFEGSSPIQSYRIYRDGQLIAMTPAETREYIDASPDATGAVFYAVTATNDDGESAPAIALNDPGFDECINFVPGFPPVTHNIPDCLGNIPGIGPIYNQFIHPIYETVRDLLPTSQ